MLGIVPNADLVAGVVRSRSKGAGEGVGKCADRSNTDGVSKWEQARLSAWLTQLTALRRGWKMIATAEASFVPVASLLTPLGLILYQSPGTVQQGIRNLRPRKETFKLNRKQGQELKSGGLSLD